MAELLELPTELFDKILQAFIAAVDLPEVFRTRAVCHTFAASINHELLANTPLQAFLKHAKSATRNSLRPYMSPEGFLCDHSREYLVYHVRNPQGANPEVPAFLRRLAENLLQLVLPKDTHIAELEEEYISKLADIFARCKNASDILPLLFRRQQCEAACWKCNGEGCEQLQPVKEQIIAANDILAAAAAVGNIEAMQHLLSKGVSAMKTTSAKNGFVSPLLAAACHPDMRGLEVLLSNAEQEFRAREPAKYPRKKGSIVWPTGEEFQLVEQARLAALDAQNSDAAFAIDKFLRENFDEPPCAKLLDASIKSGCIDVVDKLLGTNKGVPNLSTSYQHYLQACHLGHIEMVRYLLEHNVFKATPPQSPSLTTYPDAEDPLSSAVSSCQRGVARMLLDHGARASSKHLSVILSSSSFPRLPMAHLLLEHGSTVDLDVVLKCETIAMRFLQPNCTSFGRLQETPKFFSKSANISDQIGTLVLLSSYMKDHLYSMELPETEYLEQLLKNVAEGDSRLPTDVMDFQKAAKEAYEWLVDGQNASSKELGATRDMTKPNVRELVVAWRQRERTLE